MTSLPELYKYSRHRPNYCDRSVIELTVRAELTWTAKDGASLICNGVHSLTGGMKKERTHARTHVRTYVRARAQAHTHTHARTHSHALTGTHIPSEDKTNEYNYIHAVNKVKKSYTYIN